MKIRLLKRWNSGLSRPFLIFLVPSHTWEHLHHHHHPNHRHHHPDQQDLDQDQEWCPASAPYQHSAASASTCYRSPVSGALHGDDNDDAGGDDDENGDWWYTCRCWLLWSEHQALTKWQIPDIGHVPQLFVIVATAGIITEASVSCDGEGLLT